MVLTKWVIPPPALGFCGLHASIFEDNSCWFEVILAEDDNTGKSVEAIACHPNHLLSNMQNYEKKHFYAPVQRLQNHELPW